MSPILIAVLAGVGVLFVVVIVLLVVMIRGQGERELKSLQQEGEERETSDMSCDEDEEEQQVVIPPCGENKKNREVEIGGETSIVNKETPRSDETVIMSTKPKHIAYFAVKEGVHRGTLFRLPEKDRIEIGRDESNDIVLDDLEVSRKHMVVQWKEGNFVLYDYVSKGGTFVNGNRIEGPHTLSDKDEIRVGGNLLVFLRVM